MGGSGSDGARHLALGPNTTVYVSGRTGSSDFPATPGAYDTSFNGGDADAYVAKLNDDLSSLIAATFLGGSNDTWEEEGGGPIIIDGAGNVYAGGSAGSEDFPITQDAYDVVFSGRFNDGFVSKLSNDLSTLFFSTFLGGSFEDYPCSLFVDPEGNVCIAGTTGSPDFPTTPNAYDTSFNSGIYASDIFVSKLDSNLSAAKPDLYEGDDSAPFASVIVLNDIEAQTHNFYDQGDKDWVKFYGMAGESYQIKTKNLQASCDTVITLYDSSAETVIASVDANPYGMKEALSWSCTSDGMYYVMIKQKYATAYGGGTEYDLRAARTGVYSLGTIVGQITNANTGLPIQNALIMTTGNGTGISTAAGSYTIYEESGTYNVTAEAEGYQGLTETGVVVTEGVETTINFSLVPIAPDLVYIESSGQCGGNSPCYFMVQGGIDVVLTPGTIRMAEGHYDEDIVVDEAKELILEGGWDSDFTVIQSESSINSLTIENGTVIPERIIVGRGSAP